MMSTGRVNSQGVVQDRRQRIQPAQRAKIGPAIHQRLQALPRMARQVAVGADHHRATFVAEAMCDAQHLRHTVALDPGLVASAQPAGAATGQDAETQLFRCQHQPPRLTCRISRRFFSIWRSVSTFFLPS